MYPSMRFVEEIWVADVWVSLLAKTLREKNKHSGGLRKRGQHLITSYQLPPYARSLLFCSHLPLAWLIFQWGTVCSAYHLTAIWLKKKKKVLKFELSEKEQEIIVSLQLCSSTCMHITSVSWNDQHVCRCVCGIHITVHCLYKCANTCDAGI